MATAGMTAIGISIAMFVGVGVLGPSAAVADFPPAPPWPPWFLHAGLSAQLAGALIWLALLLGCGGLVAALVALRGGWRPRPGKLIAGSVLAVTALAVTPPMGSADMLDYAVYGRIAALGHNPYVMFPEQLKSSGDPVGALAVAGYANQPPRYGPLAIATDMMASDLAGDSAARTIFWMKVWNGLAYLLVVAALDRLARLDPGRAATFRSPGSDSGQPGYGTARRVRAHLLWSLNPLMLWAVMAGGHNDGLAAGAGAVAWLAMSRPGTRRGLLAGAVVGLATAIKAPFALYGAGLAWAARRSPRTLCALAAGAAAILIPAYLLAGRVAVSATIGDGSFLSYYTPGFAVARVLGLQHEVPQVNILGLACSAVLAVILLRRMPPGHRELPAIRVALALALAWLLVSPQQHGWYFALIFPLLALFPASRLDWIVIVEAAVAALAEVPWPVSPVGLHPAWLSSVMRIGYTGGFPLVLAAATGVLWWVCRTKGWSPRVAVNRGRHRLVPGATRTEGDLADQRSGGR